MIATELERLGIEFVIPDESLKLSRPPLVQPKTVEELAEVMLLAHHQGCRVLPMGAGTKLGWGGLLTEVDLYISTARLNQVIEHCAGDLTVTVQAGVSFATLQKQLANAGQHLALDPHFAERATVGGVLSTADTGSLRQHYGGVRDMVLGLEFVRSDGQRAKAGGRVVKNVAGYDLMKLFTGAWGTLGIVTQMTWRLYPQAQSQAILLLTGTSSQIAEALTLILASALTPAILDVLSPSLIQALNLGTNYGLLLAFQGLPGGVTEQLERLAKLIPTSLTQEKIPTLIPAQTCLHQGDSITVKIGFPLAQSLSLLTALEEITPLHALLHAGRGIGYIRLAPDVALATFPKLRALCQKQGGYLTILAAPTLLKQQFDTWGYSGNALDLMRRLKQQFDPLHLLSPGRFVGGI